MTGSLPEETPSGALNLLWVRNWLFLIVAVATTLQLFLHYSLVNLEMSALLIAGAWIGIAYVFDRDRLLLYPISTLMLLGYVISRYVAPPIGQLSELHSITHLLNNPILVEAYDLAGLAFLLIAHIIYRKFSLLQDLRHLIESKFYAPLGFFVIPRGIEYWLIGLAGIAATIFSTHFGGSSGGGVSSAVFNVLKPLTYVPYLVAGPALADPAQKENRRTRWLPLALYTGVVFAVSLVTNSRGFMLTGLVSLVLAYLYRVLAGDMRGPKISLKSLIILVCAFFIITGPITNLAASMVIARKNRAEVSRMALAKETWSIYRSGIAAKAYSESLHRGAVAGEYNESYYNNIFLNRVANLKFEDLSIEAKRGAELVGDIGYFRRVEYEKCLAILPAPLIRALKINVDKNKILGGSSEDFLYQEATGTPVGGFKVGSIFVLLDAAFGLMWPFVLIVTSVLLFSVADALSMLKSGYGRHAAKDVVVLSPFVVVTLYFHAFFFVGGGAIDFPAILSSLTRGWLQIGILYGIVYFLIRWLSGVISPVGYRELS